jgi:hypothetical protein
MPFPLAFENVIVGLRVIRLSDGKPGVVTELNSETFRVRFDGHLSAPMYPGPSGAPLFTSILEPGNHYRAAT